MNQGIPGGGPTATLVSSVGVTDEIREEIEDKSNNKSFLGIGAYIQEQSQGVKMETLKVTSDQLHLLQPDTGWDNTCETVVMEKLFEVCDRHNKGMVRVSDLVDYLRTILDLNLQEDAAVGSLIEILDPENINAKIGIEAFQSGLHKWIEKMKSIHSQDSRNVTYREDSVMSFSLSAQENLSLNYSLEESAMEDRLSVSELSSQLADSQYQNRRLSEENYEVRALIDIKEEELVKLSCELLDVKARMKRLQELADQQHETLCENEDLRQQIVSLCKDLDLIKHKLYQSEQEKIILQNQVEDGRKLVTRLNSELEESRRHQDELKASLAKTKDKNLHLKETIENLDILLSEKAESLQALQSHHGYITQHSKDLRIQYQELQGELIQTQAELSSLKSAHETSNGIVLPSLKELADEIEEDSEHSETSSVCEWPSSIRNELRELFSDSPNLPWPLSDKELRESVVTTPDLVSHTGISANTDQHKTNCQREGTNSWCVDEDKKSENTILNKCMNCDTHYDITNEQLRNLVLLLRNFKEENLKLKHVVKQTLLKTQLCLYDRSDEKPRDLTREPTHDGVQEEVDGLKPSPSNTVKLLKKQNKMLSSEITKLKRSNLELAEKLHKSELKICDLDEEAKKTWTYLEREKQKCADLEENLYSNTLARQLDLRDIWRLVQKDVETECQDEQDDSFNSNSPDKIKESIKRDIEALRVKLEKRGAALGALKRHNLNLPLSWNSEDIQLPSTWHSSHRLSPGSPLVDALSIDVFNGNLQMYPIKYPYTASVVSCEDVDCYECKAARMVLQNRYTTSCPSIGSTDNGQQEHMSSKNYSFATNSNICNGNDKQHPASSAPPTKLTSESCPYPHNRQRSLYGNHRRQNFIKSSGRYLFDKPISSDHQFENHSHNVVQSSAGSTATDLYPVLDSNVNNSSCPVVSWSLDNILPLADTTESNLGARRTSFIKAVENNQDSESDSYGTKLYDVGFRHIDVNAISEELQRPSFCAAIAHGRGVNSGVSIKRKVVQINPPETLKIRTKRIKDYSLPSNDDNMDGVQPETPKTVKFQIEEDQDSNSQVYTGALAWGSSVARTENAIALSSLSFPSLSSSMTSSSVFTSTPSPFEPGHGGYNQSVSRSASMQGCHKLDVILDNAHSYVSKSVEDWDMSPQHTGNCNDFCDEFMNRTDYEQEALEYLTGSWEDCPDVSQCTQEAGDMPGAMNPLLTGQEAVQGLKDTMAPLERFSKIPDTKSSVSAPHNLRQGAISSTRRIPTDQQTSHATTAPTSVVVQKKNSTPPGCLVQTGNESKQPSGRAVQPNEGLVKGRKILSTEDLASCEVEAHKFKIVVPENPVAQVQPSSPSRLAKIRQSHLASKKREQLMSKSMKLPELSEHSELETANSGHRPLPSHEVENLLAAPGPLAMPQISVSLAPTDEPAAPAISAALLSKLGLSVKSSDGDDNRGNGASLDQLSEKEIESKFVNLSLAFKSDKLTLDQRVSVQERQRDLAEQNVDMEIKGLRDAVESLYELVSEEQIRAVLLKIRQHINVLEQAAARVSSRAEVFGAVQEERKLCKSMEIVVLYTENLRRIREKEESELLEARKVLSERTGNGYNPDDASPNNRRSMSVCGFNPGGRPMRRRSEIALPRVLGGAGSPSLMPTASLENTSPYMERTNPTHHFLNVSSESDGGEDAKSRFQSAVASTSMQNAVTNTMKRSSLEKQRSNSVTFTPTPSPSGFSLNPSSVSLPRRQLEVDSTSGNSDDKSESENKVSQDEDAFRKGFEEGLKAKLSQELTEMRDHQNSISQSLEHMMDKVDLSQQEEEELLSRPTRLDTIIKYSARLKDFLVQHDWRTNKKAIRNLAGLFFVFLAILVVFLSPPLNVKHVTNPPQ